MTTDAGGLGWFDYLTICRRLGREPDHTLSPAARVRALPPGMCVELLATPEAVVRVKAWQAAGAPTVDLVAVVRALRCSASERTHQLLVDALTAGTMAPAAVWYLLGHVAVWAVGRDARGMATVPPDSGFERVIILNDAEIADDELVSIALHEMAHAMLLPPPQVLSRTDAALLTTDAGSWLQAVRYGFEEQMLERQILDEIQACRLAARWGATGLAIDAEHCTAHPRARLLRVRATKVREAHAAGTS